MSEKEQPLLSSLVWAEYVCYAALNTVTNINTVMSLSSLLNVFTFLPEGLYQGFWIFASKLILTQKGVDCTKKLGATHPKKIICVGQKCLGQ